MKKILVPLLITAGIIIAVFLLFENIEIYFSNLLQVSIHQKGRFALLSFLVLTSDIILPVPSSIVMYTNGLILGLVEGTILSFFSSICGATIGYFLGMYTSIGFKATQDLKAVYLIEKYGALALLITRGIPILSESIGIICGYHKMQFRKYITFNLIGYLPLCLLYAFFGSIGYDKNTFLLSFLCAILLSAGFWFFGKSRLLNPDQVKIK